MYCYIDFCNLCNYLCFNQVINLQFIIIYVTFAADNKLNYYENIKMRAYHSLCIRYLMQ